MKGDIKNIKQNIANLRASLDTREAFTEASSVSSQLAGIEEDKRNKIEVEKFQENIVGKTFPDKEEVHVAEVLSEASSPIHQVNIGGVDGSNFDKLHVTTRYKEDGFDDCLAKKSICFSRKNFKFIQKLRELHRQDFDYVVNKLLDAARLGVPYHMETNLTEELKTALDFIEKRRTLHRRAVEMYEKQSIKFDDECPRSLGDCEDGGGEVDGTDSLPEWLDI